ncbi:MAG TPA: flagellar basal body rod protein FlgB, partial [Gammaproteobacteria bacterium]
MTINFDKALGIHDKALLLFERRTQLLAENISNADTPNYKARDIDFDKMLQQANAGQLQMKATQPGHIGYPQDAMSTQVQYRIPEQSSADGNTVDIQKEKA